MLIIYSFGLRLTMDFGMQYVAAYNLVNLIADPTCDALTTIETVAKIDISQSKFNYKKAIKRSMVITAGYILISLVLYFALFKVYNVNLSIGLIYLSICLVSLINYLFNANLRVFLQLSFSATVSTSINLFNKLIRTTLAVAIISPYNVSIAMLVSMFIGFILFSAVRFKFFHLAKDGTLIRKINVKS